MSATIAEVRAREVLDSRGNPTLEAEVGLSDGASGRAIVPSGASTGSHEAAELRDGDPARFRGAGVLTAVANVVERIAPAVRGHSPFDQAGLDRRMLELDGTPEKSNLGANAILGVSLAAAHAAAASRGQPLYRHLADGEASLLPVPLFNVLNGGKHAADSTDIQEFMLAPAGAPTYAEALRAGAEAYQALKRVLTAGGYSTNVGDEGGYAPSLPSNRSALAALVEAISLAGYAPGKDVFLALDVAASELFEDGRYALPREGAVYTSAELVSFYASLVEAFPIVSIEDGLAEDDWDGWALLVQRLGGTVQLVGDDLLTTSAAAHTPGHRHGRSERAAGEAQPGGDADGDAGGHGAGPGRRMGHGHEPPLGRDGGHDHRRPCSGDGRGGRSRRARPPAPSAWPSTTDCCVSRRSLGRGRGSQG